MYLSQDRDKLGLGEGRCAFGNEISGSIHKRGIYCRAVLHGIN